jgi:signal transduction histidine kinase
MSRLSIKMRVFVAILVATLLGLAALLVMLQAGHRQDVEAQGERALRSSAQAFEDHVTWHTQLYESAVDSLLEREDIALALERRDAEELLRVSTPSFQRLRERRGATHLYFILPDGEVLLRVHRPGESGDVLTRASFLEAQAIGSYGAALELGRTAYALRVVHPVYSRTPSPAEASGATGRLVGYVEVAGEVDHFLSHMRGRSQGEYGLMLSKARLDRAAWTEFRAQNDQRDDWNDHPTLVLSSETTRGVVALAGLDVDIEALPDDGKSLGTRCNGDKTWGAAVFPIVDADGTRSGAVYVAFDLTEFSDATLRSQMHVAGLGILMALVLSGAVHLVFRFLVFARLDAMVARMRQQVPDAPPSEAGGADEIAEFESELRHYRSHLESMVQARTAELARSNEELTEATRTKDRLMANMSHELRTPLNSIIGYTDVVLKGWAGDLTEEQQLQLGYVYSSGQHLLELVDNLLDLTHIDAGGASLRLSEFTLGEFVEEVVACVRPMAKGKYGLSLESECATPDAMLFTDRGKLAQILRNVLDNAIKYTDDGEVSVRAWSDSDRVSLTVSDTGPGIPSDDIERIFDEFEQVRAEGMPHPSSGVGLGLAISRRLASMLGGTIAASSEPDHGSTFTVTVPLRLPDEDAGVE